MSLRDTAIRQDHAVLAARTPDGWRILDNRRAAVVMDSALPDYLALASLDESGVKLLAAHLRPPRARPATPAGRGRSILTSRRRRVLQPDDRYGFRLIPSG